VSLRGAEGTEAISDQRLLRLFEPRNDGSLISNKRLGIFTKKLLSLHLTYIMIFTSHEIQYLAISKNETRNGSYASNEAVYAAVDNVHNRAK